MIFRVNPPKNWFWARIAFQKLLASQLDDVLDLLRFVCRGILVFRSHQKAPFLGSSGIIVAKTI
jgi:hypothetical protein